MAISKATLEHALAVRAVDALLLDDLIYELHRADVLPTGNDEVDDQVALETEAQASALTNAGIPAQLDFLIEKLGSPQHAALALSDFLALPVVLH